MSEQHTPEPWSVSPLGIHIHAEHAICQFFDQGGDDFLNHEANARRIAACVNACKDIDIGVLESDGFPMQIAGILALKKQRDELLAAAEAIEIDAEECLDFDECTAMLVPIDTYHKLMEAIASARGAA